MQRSALALATAFTLGLGACQSVDLNQQSGPPTCAVAPSDYKLLRYWNDRTDDKKYTRIIGLLEKKYASAPKVGGRSAVVAAQSYVRSNASTEPLTLEANVSKACASK